MINNRNGFTMTELIISMVIMSMVGLMAVSVFTPTVTSFKKVSEKNLALELCNTALISVENRLAAAAEAEITDTPPQTGYYISADNGRLTFYDEGAQKPLFDESFYNNQSIELKFTKREKAVIISVKAVNPNNEVTAEITSPCRLYNIEGEIRGEEGSGIRFTQVDI